MSELNRQNRVWGPGEAAQHLRAFAAFPENPRSVPRTHMTASMKFS